MTGVTTEDVGLAKWFAAAARELGAIDGTQDILDEVCELSVAVVAGCRAAGVTEGRNNQPGEVLAWSDEVVRELHAAQYKFGDGPGFDAIWHERVVWVDDLATERRWPRFAGEAVARGFRSLVAIQLYTHDHTLGVLSLYSDASGTFDEVTRDVAQIFASHAAISLRRARQHADLSRGLTTRQRIGQATGILAERHGLRTDDAFRMLVRASQSHNVKLRDLADRLVTAEDETR